LTNCVEL